MATCLSGSSSFSMYFVLYVVLIAGQYLRSCQSAKFLELTSPKITYMNTYKTTDHSSKLKDGVLGGPCVNDGNILR